MGKRYQAFDWAKYQAGKRKANGKLSTKLSEWVSRWAGLLWLAAVLLALVAGVVYEIGWRNRWW